MEKFLTLQSKMIPLAQNDIDTDQIIPAQYLKVTDKNGLAAGLFAGWRYHPSGEINTDFPLNQDQYQGSEILLAGDNFGCGSSREHAPWALTQWGIRAIISTSFADIFYNNSLKNGLLPIVVSESIQRKLFEITEDIPTNTITVDLPNQMITAPGAISTQFPIDPFNKNCLVEGIDSLGYLQSHLEQIIAFEEKQWGGYSSQVNTRAQEALD